MNFLKLIFIIFIFTNVRNLTILRNWRKTIFLQNQLLYLYIFFLSWQQNGPTWSWLGRNNFQIISRWLTFHRQLQFSIFYLKFFLTSCHHRYPHLFLYAYPLNYHRSILFLTSRIPFKNNRWRSSKCPSEMEPPSDYSALHKPSGKRKKH
jgi:hypothetical protein